MFKRSDDTFVKEKKHRKKNKETELSESFLPEGGGLDAGQLDKLNAINRSTMGSARKSKSRNEDSTHIDGLTAFDVDGTGLF